MRGLAVQPGLSVLPGAVQRLLDVGRWDEFGLLLYTDDRRVFVVEDGATLRQVLDVALVVSGAINPKTGYLALMTEEVLVLYAPKVFFGQPLRYQEVYRLHLSHPCCQVSWLSASGIVASYADGTAEIIDLESKEVLWSVKAPLVGNGIAANVRTGRHIFQYGACISRLWTFEDDHWELEYIPSPLPVLWAQWMALSLPVLVAWCQDRVLRVWKSTDLAEFWWSVQVSSEERFIVCEDRDALLIVVYGSESTRYCRLSTAAGLTISVGPPLELPRDVDDHISVDGTYLFMEKTQSTTIDVYSNVNWEPRYECTLTGSGGGRVRAFGNSFLSLKSPALIWNSDSVQCIPENFDDAIIVDDVVVSYSNAMISWGDKKFSAPGLRGLEVRSATEIIGVCEDGLRLWTCAGESSLIRAPISVGKLYAYSQDRLVLARDTEVNIYALVEGNRLVFLDKVQLSGVEQVSVTRRGDNTDTDFLVSLITVDRIYVWDNGDLVLISKKGKQAGSSAWSHGGQFLAVSDGNNVSVWCRQLSISEPWIRVRVIERTSQYIAWLEDSTLIFSTEDTSVYMQSSSLNGDVTASEVMNSQGLDPAQISTLQELEVALNQDLPYYHPEFLVNLVAAGYRWAVGRILAELDHELRYALISDKNVADVRPQLGIEESDLKDAEWSGNVNVEAISSRLSELRLPRLTSDEHAQLAKIVTVWSSLDISSLDIAGTTFMFMRAMVSASMARVFIWAYFSTSKAALLELIRPSKLSPDTLREEGLPYWLEQPQLTAELEEMARLLYARTRNPVDVSVVYIALQKKSVLQSMWRIAAGNPEREKTMKLLNHDFTEERWRTAALKNAFALLSKHRYEYAAALFLLGGGLRDSCQTLAGAANDAALAVAVARVWEPPTNVGLALLKENFFDSNDMWLQCWAAAVVGNLELARSTLENSKDPCSTWLLHHCLGGASKKSLDHARRGYERLRCPYLGTLLPTESVETVKDIKSRVGSEWSTNSDVRKPEFSTTQEVSPEILEQEKKEWVPPKHLKPAPTNIQLEPDMSAFGF